MFSSVSLKYSYFPSLIHCVSKVELQTSRVSSFCLNMNKQKPKKVSLNIVPQKCL